MEAGLLTFAVVMACAAVALVVFCAVFEVKIALRRRPGSVSADVRHATVHPRA